LCRTIRLIDLRTLEMIEKEISAINISFTSDILQVRMQNKFLVHMIMLQQLQFEKKN
jgi:hypothetical protein